MPKVRFAPLVEEIRGTLYDVVFKRSSSGETIVTKKPDMSNVEWSQAQKAHRKRIAASNDYAHAAMADPVVRAIYEKRGAKEKRVPYRVAISDYFKGKDLLAKTAKAPHSKKVGKNHGKD
jgi:hypothetical protein